MPLLDTVCSVVQGVTFCADLKHLLKRFRTRVISRLKGVQAYFPGQRYYIFQCSRDGPCLPDTVDMQNPAAIEAVMLDDATITLEDALRQQAAKEARAQSAYRDGDEDTVAAVPTANGALFTVPDLIEEQLGYPDTSVAGPMLYLSPERAIAGASDGEGAGHEGEVMHVWRDEGAQRQLHFRCRAIRAAVPFPIAALRHRWTAASSTSGVCAS
eukprot:jgi/Mesvir1/6264/Mv01608-RA.1